ncbi:MAG: 3-oxoacid CoA-transferase subunit B [Candidatus Cloacimonadota bacterium]|nr:3-oxoacid CoA-transferase subunit B [Candidatus Cloacimonadota bacterium]
MDRKQKKIVIGRRIAQILDDGNFVNLGIGIPTEVINHIPKNIKIHIHSENGIIGAGRTPEEGKEDPNLINAGGQFITEKIGASYFDSVTSFAIIRGGHLDATVLGALQVDQKGNLANWMIPGKLTPGMGGAMDLVTGAKNVIIATEHCDKYGNSKIVEKCNLPLTGANIVNIIVTELALMQVTKDGLLLKEISDITTIDEVVEKTDADLIIADKVEKFSTKI